MLVEYFARASDELSAPPRVARPRIKSPPPPLPPPLRPPRHDDDEEGAAATSCARGRTAARAAPIRARPLTAAAAAPPRAAAQSPSPPTFGQLFEAYSNTGADVADIRESVGGLVPLGFYDTVNEQVNAWEGTISGLVQGIYCAGPYPEADAEFCGDR